jgi:hypothetical protein
MLAKRRIGISEARNGLDVDGAITHLLQVEVICIHVILRSTRFMYTKNFALIAEVLLVSVHPVTLSCDRIWSSKGTCESLWSDRDLVVVGNINSGVLTCCV